MASLNGVLETILPDGWYKDASYKVQGAVLRGVKAGLAVTSGILLAAATAGTLLPAATAPYVVAVVTLTLQAVDKFIREWKIEGEDQPPLTDEVPAELPVPLPPVVVDPEPEIPEVPEVPAEEPEPDVVPEEENPEDSEIPSPEELPDGGTALPELPELPPEEVIPLPEEPVDTTTGTLM